MSPTLVLIKNDRRKTWNLKTLSQTSCYTHKKRLKNNVKKHPQDGRKTAQAMVSGISWKNRQKLADLGSSFPLLRSIGRQKRSKMFRVRNFTKEKSRNKNRNSFICPSHGVYKGIESRLFGNDVLWTPKSILEHHLEVSFFHLDFKFLLKRKTFEK